MLHKYSFHYDFKKFLVLFIFTSFLFSCDKFDGDQTVPSYIHIEKITLVDNPDPTVVEGSLSNKITDAWVYIDDQLIGAFELPATFPVLKKGKHTISIYSGIKMNGISGTRVQYDFYKKIDIVGLNLVEDSIIKIDTLLTKTMYKENISFWIEDFEGGTINTINFQKRTNSDTTVVPTSNTGKVFEGNYSGIVTSNAFFEIEPKGDNFILPKNAPAGVFLEMNYKANNTFYVGLLVYSTTTSTTPSNQVSTIALYPTSEWKKIYINFAPDIADNYNAASFKFFIGGYKDAGNQTAEVYFDNIKLVYFKTSK